MAKLIDEYYSHVLDNKDYGIEKNIVFDIVADFTDRKGLKQEWNGIDEDIKEEILQVWIDIVSANLKK